MVAIAFGFRAHDCVAMTGLRVSERKTGLSAIVWAGLSFVVSIALLAGGTPSRAAVDAVAYQVVFTGLDDFEDLRQLIEDGSGLLGGVENPPTSFLALDRRAEADINRIDATLRSQGHYDGAAQAVVPSARMEGQPSDEPVLVFVDVTPGPLYRFSQVGIRATAGTAAVGLKIGPEQIGFAAGDAARAQPMVEAGITIARALQQEGFPRAKVTDKRVVVDHTDRTVSVTYDINAGPQARFGAVTVNGSGGVDRGFIVRRLPWTFGDVADIRKLEEGRKALLATGIFESVRVAFGETIGTDGLIPIEVVTVERPPRRISGGLFISTGDEATVNAEWQHRNLLGAGEAATVSGLVGTKSIVTSAGLTFRDVIVNDQDLRLLVEAKDTETDAFENRTVLVSAVFQRPVLERALANYGVFVERVIIEQDNRESTNSTLLGFPVGLSFARIKDPLNPTRGYRIAYTATPSSDLGEKQAHFYSLSAEPVVYVPLNRDESLVLASRLGVGATFGANTDDIPADRRQYAGGSASVRGYSFQSVGPLDDQNDPIGGRSSIDGAVELRWRFFGDFGVAGFVDFGQVYDDELPDFGESLRLGAGIGARYFSPIGPIRADLAIPLDARDSDDDFQLYLSIGQAF